MQWGAGVSGSLVPSLWRLGTRLESVAARVRVVGNGRQQYMFGYIAREAETSEEVGTGHTSSKNAGVAP